MDRILRLISEGWRIFDSCYESDEDIIKEAERQGYKQIKSYRVKTDTKGLKMYCICVK